MMELRLETENLLTVKEAMQELGVSHATLYRWIEKGKIRPVKIGQGRTTFFKREDIAASKQAVIQQQLALELTQ